MIAILESSGLEPADLVKIRIFGIERWREFDAFCAEIMGSAKPARAVVSVSKVHFGSLVEIEAVAQLRGP